uniref:Tetratricopeptide repeat protein n=1 Tax=Eutreptiella gymnastica TaxID=73025 RepID=A0A7S1I2N4_9EUGL|mmetsp:Transcript_124196/g.215271  ORF Transcript_124196/g.215271 Transcript_124196/m.215271 type:complete len:269 (+) Transcript_124196:47-853(+)
MPGASWWLFMCPIAFLWILGTTVMILHAPDHYVDEFDTTSNSRTYGPIDVQDKSIEAFTDVEKYPDISRSTLNQSYELYLQADHEVSLGRPNYAMNFLTRAIDLNPQSPKLLMKRAFVRAQFRNETGLAVEDLIASIQLDPEDSAVHYNLGVLRYGVPDVDAALADFSEAVNIDPVNVKAYNNRGVVFKDMAYYTAALDDYDRAITLAPEEPFAYFNRGVLRNQLKDYAEALQDFDRYILLSPNDTAAKRKREIVAKRAKGPGLHIGH